MIGVYVKKHIDLDTNVSFLFNTALSCYLLIIGSKYVIYRNESNNSETLVIFKIMGFKQYCSISLDVGLYYFLQR